MQIAIDPETDLINIFDEEEEDDDDSDAPSGEATISDEEARQKDVADAKKEFKTVIKTWAKLTIPWKELYPSMDNSQNDLFGDLMKVNMKPLMDWIVKRNSDMNGSLGYLPAMCRNSVCQLGALNSQSFVERMNSAANLIATKRISNLADELIDKLVVIRMNQNFVMHCHQNKPITHVNLSKFN